MESTANSTTPKRSENWTKVAVPMLARLAAENRKVLKGSFAQNIRAADKQRVWEEITAHINNAFPQSTRGPRNKSSRSGGTYPPV